MKDLSLNNAITCSIIIHSCYHRKCLQHAHKKLQATKDPIEHGQQHFILINHQSWGGGGQLESNACVKKLRTWVLFVK